MPNSVTHFDIHAQNPAGLTYRAIPDVNGWMLYANVASVDETVALVERSGAAE